MTSAAQILSIARGELGYSRWDDPEAGTKYGRWYSGRTKSPYFGASGVPFCAMGVSWVFDQAGGSLFADNAVYAYCPWIERDAVKHGRARGFDQIEPGDVLTFDWDGDGVADHVGFAVSREGDYVRTIEFNTSGSWQGSQSDGGGVFERTRHRSTVSMVVRPAYAAAAVPAVGGLTVDGVWGEQTTRALQQVLGTPVDGVVSSQNSANLDHYPAAGTGWEWVANSQGSQVITALQRKVGAGADGIAGFETAKALQRYLGVPADGYVGEQTVKAMQQRLNVGGF